MRKYTLNEDYFYNIDKEENAYWLGFISADGNVCKTSRYESWRLTINLKYDDENHLEKFKNSIKSTSPIIRFKNENPKSFGISEQVLFRLNSKKLCGDLITLGVTPNKSRTIEFPDIEEEFYSHYIRGFIDGDGSFSYVKRKDYAGYRFSFEIVGVSIKILESFQKIFKQYNINCNIYKRKSNDSYRLMISSKKDLINLINFLYNDSVVYLERKYNKACKLLELAVQGRNTLNH